MQIDLERIAEVTAKAKIFAASVREGTPEVHFVGTMDALCEHIDTEIRFARLPGNEYAGESASRVRVLLEQLSHLLTKMQALELAREVYEAREKPRREKSRGGKARAKQLKQLGEETKATAREWAEHFEAAGMAQRDIAGAVALKMGITDTHARRLLRK